MCFVFFSFFSRSDWTALPVTVCDKRKKGRRRRRKGTGLVYKQTNNFHVLHAGETWLISVDASNQQRRPLHHQQFTLSCSGVQKRRKTTLRSTRKIRLRPRRTNVNRCTLKRLPSSSSSNSAATWLPVVRASPSAATTSVASRPITQVIHRWFRCHDPLPDPLGPSYF